MKYFTIAIFLLYFCVSAIRSSNILIFVPSPWKSHIVSFQPLFLELANLGHNVTVVSKFSAENPPRNYKQLVPSYVFDIDERSDFLMEERSSQYLFYESLKLRNTLILDTTDLFLSDSVVQNFIKEDQSRFDLVIIESFFQECTIALGHKYNAPVVSLVPMAPWVSVSRWAANPSDFSYIKDFENYGGKFMNFWERLTNAYVGFYSILADPIIYYPKLENMMNKYFQYPGYKNRPTITEMLKNVSLHLIDSDVMFLSPRPYMPSFIEVPGIHVLNYNEKLDKKLLNFMNKAVTGVVYFNFGTILNVTSIPKHSMQTLIHVLGQLEQKVVFRWINNDTKGFPKNFYVNSWLQQQEILNHPNCKLFITHGGNHGLMEAINAGVPVIGFPVFGDQFQNLKTIQENGIGIVRDIFKLTEKTFKQDVNYILTDQKFFENAKRLSSIIRDRPMPSIDVAVYWVEYVIRHKGAHHLRAAAVDLTWYQYYLIDVFVVFAFVIFLLTCICCLMFKLVILYFLNVLVKLKNKIKMKQT